MPLLEEIAVNDDPKRVDRVTYVVHSQKVIAEDIREILMGLGRQDIHMVRRISDLPVVPAALIVIAADASAAECMTYLKLWSTERVPVVWLDGPESLAANLCNFVSLRLPFLPEDVAEALQQLGLL